MPNIEPPSDGTYSVQEFCNAHKISKPFFYALLREGRAPVTFKLGRRRLISKAAAAKWLRDREKESES